MTRYYSKRPSVKQVTKWYDCYAETITNWNGNVISVLIEEGYPFSDFYRVTYTIDGVKKSKLFFGESAHNTTEMFVYDMGFRSCLGVL